MRNRIFALLIVVAMLTLPGCSAEKMLIPEELTEPAEIIDYEPVEVPVEPIKPTPVPEPETVTGICLANGLKAVYKSLARGESVKILDEDGEHYLIEGGEDFRGDPAVLLVEKKYIKTDSEPIEPHTVYCVGNAPVYESAACRSEQIILYAIQNAEVTVADEMSGIVYIEWRETGEDNSVTVRHGYMKKTDISEDYISSAVWYGGSGDGGGGAASDYGYDGGDIAAGELLKAGLSGGRGGTMMYLAPIKHSAVLRSMAAHEIPVSSGDGICFSDEIPVYAGILKYGDEVKLLSETAGNADQTVKILLNGCICEIPEYVIRMPDDEPYAAWEGYVQNNVTGYFTYDLSDAGREIPVNSCVTVEDEILGILIIRDGENIYYFSPASIGTEEYVAPPANYGWYSAGGSSEVVDSWTPPTL